MHKAADYTVKDKTLSPAVICIHDKDADLPTFSMDLDLLLKEVCTGGFLLSWNASLQISLDFDQLME